MARFTKGNLGEGVTKYNNEVKALIKGKLNFKFGILRLCLDFKEPYIINAVPPKYYLQQ